MSRAYNRATVGDTVTPGFLIGAGLLAAVTALFAMITEVRSVGEPTIGGYLEFLMLAVPAVGLVYAGYWLHTADFGPGAVWRIGVLAVGGAVVAAVITTALLQLWSVPAMTPAATFVLFVGTTTEGSLLGVLVGTFAVTDSRFRRERSAAEELETLGALLRHDVRNRLNLIVGHLTLIREAADVPAENLDVIQAQLDAIESVLADTAAATVALRNEEGTEPVDLTAVVRERLEVLRETHTDVRVRTELPDGLLVRADHLFAAVLDNLLTNAVTHHDTGTPEIEVTATVTDDEVRLSVADDGPGIPPARRTEVFEPGEGDGTGMGLYLVRTVVEGYGGSVDIDDNEPRGTVVTLTLPRAHRGRVTPRRRTVARSSDPSR